MDIIGELLRANMLEQIADDEERVGRLRNAATALADRLAAEDRTRLPQALLTAVDPASHANAPMLRVARAEILKAWDTLANVFPEQPVELYRAVLLAAASAAFAGDDQARAAGWYTLRNVIQFLPTGRWTIVLRQLHAELDGTTGAAAELAWTPAALDDSHKEVTETAATKRAVEIAAVSSGSYGMYFSDALQKNLVDLVGELTAEMSAVSQRHLDRLNATASRMELLWWRSTAYSASQRRRYEELPAPLAVAAAAIDVHRITGMLSSVSVEHVLYDTVAAAVTETVTVGDLAASMGSAALAEECATATDGTLIGAVTAGTSTPLAAANASLSAAETAVVLFRELQAARLLAQPFTAAPVLSAASE